MKVAIIGAGIAGLVSAVRLLQAGHAVRVLEKIHAGAGSSGKSLGLLVPSTMERAVDELQREGIALWPSLIDELALLVPGTHKDRLFRAWQLPDGRTAYQLKLPDIFHVLRDAILNLGGDVAEMTKGEVSGDWLGYDALLLAAGWDNAGWGVGGMSVMAGQAIRLKPKHPLPELPLRLDGHTYVCPDWDGSVMVGSRSWSMAQPGDPTPREALTDDLYQSALAMAPDLNGADVIDSWIGFRPISNPRLPLVRKLDGDFSGRFYGPVWAVAGLGKIGIGLAPVVAREAVARVAG